MVTTKAVKSTALTHLRDDWGRACTVAMIPVFATIAVALMGYLFTLPFGTVIAGIIPSHKAAKSDPVAALRTE